MITYRIIAIHHRVVVFTYTWGDGFTRPAFIATPMIGAN